MKRNVGTADRLIRALVIAPAAILWAGAASWTGVWAIVALAIAAIMLATAAVGFCPLYALLRIDTTGSRRAVHA
ncbi:MAG: DUF2892 domain-containing protein [Actinomycetota bacterium]